MTAAHQDATPFRITTSLEDGRRIVTAEGELDFTTVAQLEHRLTRSLTEGHTVLDLSGVSFIDSSGIALLVSVSRAAREHGQSLDLRNYSPQVDRLVNLTGVSELLGSPAR